MKYQELYNKAGKIFGLKSGEVIYFRCGMGIDKRVMINMDIKGDSVKGEAFKKLMIDEITK